MLFNENFRWFCLFFVVVIYSSNVRANIDPNGYVVFCPCMGRFGNQAEQFLGAMRFASVLNRTLVLPHWIEYPSGHALSKQIPFDRYFQVQPFESDFKVILMKDFMVQVSEALWPKGKRYVFCYTAQNDDKSPKKSCRAKEGNPFGPYWSHFNIDFDGDMFYEPLYFDVHIPDRWNEKFPVENYPVLAFSGPPGSFPAEERNIPLAKYLVYSDYIRGKVDAFLKSNNIDLTKTLAIHLRNGIDFERACGYINENTNFFASAQCLGHRLEKGIHLTRDICYPSEENILIQTQRKLKETQSKFLFVAADGNPMLDKFQRSFSKKFSLKIFKYDRTSKDTEGEAAHIDLFLLSNAAHAIVNCPSSFSAFAKRQRDAQGKTTDFWGVENEHYSRATNADL